MYSTVRFPSVYVGTFISGLGRHQTSVVEGSITLWPLCRYRQWWRCCMSCCACKSLLEGEGCDRSCRSINVSINWQEDRCIPAETKGLLLWLHSAGVCCRGGEGETPGQVFFLRGAPVRFGSVAYCSDHGCGGWFGVRNRSGGLNYPGSLDLGRGHTLGYLVAGLG